MPEPTASIIADARELVRSDPAKAVALLAPFAANPVVDPAVLHVLATAHRALSDEAAAARIDHLIVERQSREPDTVAAIRLFADGHHSDAERVLRNLLRRHAGNVPALCLLAQLAQRAGIFPDAERLLRAALDITPGFADARRSLAQVLFSRNDAAGAIALLDGILELQPDDPASIAMKLRILGQTGNYDHALELYEALLAHDAEAHRLWIGYANLLKTLGRSRDSRAAFRRAIAIEPGAGDGWWGLAELKIPTLDAADIATMRSTLTRTDLTADARVKIDFALGKALGDENEHRAAFDHYCRANARHRAQLEYDPAATTREVDRAIATFTSGFFAARSGSGSAAADPIFILGMPRAGSTLIEQILASHPLVEGTSELPDIPLLLQRVLAEHWRDGAIDTTAAVAALSRDTLCQLGKSYLSTTRQHRKSDRPFFIDKLPNNWLNVGFIHLILPNARIIDARRDPLPCCFANFTQHFAQGQEFTYDLTDMGRYYRDYVRLMAHFETVLPQRVRRVDHARLTAAPEHVITTLLANLDLPFDPACLRPHENSRPVRTASAEQVRQPIMKATDDRWLPYEPWLGPLKRALAEWEL